MTRMLAAATALALTAPFSAHAACSFTNDVPVKGLVAKSDAWTVVTEAMAECGNVDIQHRRHESGRLPADLATNPSAYHIRSASNASLASLVAQGAVRPLDDLVAAYGPHLSPRELIEIDGKVMAIAISLSAEHLVYRADILQEQGLKAPGTFDQVLSMATVIQDAGVIDHAFAGAYRTGSDLGLAFINLFAGFGGELPGDGGGPVINNEIGMKTLTMMKALAALMPPDYADAEPEQIWQQVQDGKIAMAVLPPMDQKTLEALEQSPVGDKLAVEAAPRVIEGGKPATTLWWDGFVIAESASDREAAAAFQVAMEALDEEMASAHPDTALWLVDGFEPGAYARGTIASVIGGAAPYPMSAGIGSLHALLGSHVASFLNDEATAEETLAQVEEAYRTRMKDENLVQ